MILFILLFIVLGFFVSLFSGGIVYNTLAAIKAARAGDAEKLEDCILGIVVSSFYDAVMIFLFVLDYLMIVRYY